MSELKSRADLFEAAAKMMRMCDEAGIEYVCKNAGVLIEDAEKFCYDAPAEAYEFPLAVVEGRPVFKGDELYWSDGSKFIADKLHALPNILTASNCCGSVYANDLSWLPPKPRTVMVELLREDAEKIVKFDAVMHMTIGGVETRILAEACRKALDEK